MNAQLLSLGRGVSLRNPNTLSQHTQLQLGRNTPNDGERTEVLFTLLRLVACMRHIL
jgi:hypothetical protein